jgi:putative ABC transport system ATP-binding protein
MDSLIEPSSLAGLEPDTIAISNVNLSLGAGAARVHILKDISLRVALARALAPDPAILVADEPTGNLDEATGKQIVDLLFTQHAERGMTLVLVTHDTALAQRCDRVVRLRSGRIDGQPPDRKAAS